MPWRHLVLLVTVVQMALIPIGCNGAATPKHKEGAPAHVDVPTIPPFSLNSACAQELREICEMRSPFQQKAIECFEAHRSELSPTCGEWHDARMHCKTQIESSTFEQCPECRKFCGVGLSLMHCIRAAGNRITAMGVDSKCLDTAFFKSINRHYKLKHFPQ